MANLSDHLFRQERERADKQALHFQDRSWTYGEIARRTRLIAGGLSRMGVEVGSRVGLMMPSRPKFIFTQQAIFALGAIVSPLNIFYRSGEIVHAISSCDLEFLVIDESYLDRLPPRGAPGTQSLRRVFVAFVNFCYSLSVSSPFPQFSPVFAVVCGRRPRD